MLYGAGDPRGRQPSQTSAQALGLEDLRAFHAAYFVPDHAILGVRGDFDGKAMLAKLEKLFGAWPRKATPKPELPPLTQTPQRKIYYVHRPGLRQTNIAMGHFGVNLLDPDMQKIEVFNLIFGSGSMSNRLFRSVRSEKGFAYSVSGRVRGNIDRGLFLILCQTKPDSTVDAIETVFGEIEKIRSAPPSPDEMRGAADATINSFVFEFEDAGDVLHKSMDIAFYGYPEDYWDGYLKRIRAVTAADVTAMAVKHVRPEEILTVVVGDEALFGRPLSDLGEVVRVTPDWK
jgi:zinc protease